MHRLQCWGGAFFLQRCCHRLPCFQYKRQDIVTTHSSKGADQTKNTTQEVFYLSRERAGQTSWNAIKIIPFRVAAYSNVSTESEQQQLPWLVLAFIAFSLKSGRGHHETQGPGAPMGSAENLREAALEGFCASMCPSVWFSSLAVASDLEGIIIQYHAI